MTLPLRRGAIAALLAVTFVPFTAEADLERNRFYASVSGLYLVPTDSRSSGESSLSSDYGSFGDLKYSSEIDMDGGFGLLAAFGYGPEIGLRAEIEIGFRKSDWVVDSTNHRSSTLTQTLTQTQTQTQAENAPSMMPLAGLVGQQLTPEEEMKLEELRRLFLALGSSHGSLQSMPDNRPSAMQVDDLSAAQYSGNTESLSLMANGIYTFDAGRLRPYVGVGFGIARHDVTLDAQSIEVTYTRTSGDEEESDTYTFEIERRSRDDTVLAMQAMFGVSFPVSERLEARLGYRYFRTRDTGDSDGNGLTYSTRNIEAGLLFRF